MRKIFLLIVIVFSIVEADGQISLDPTFGNKGIVKETFQGSGNALSESARSLLIQADGKYIVVLDIGGAYTILNRRMSNGDKDPTYGTNGFSVSVKILSASAAMQSDGKIIVAGSSLFENSDFIIARFNIDGTLDPSFGDEGIIIIDVGSRDDLINSVLIDPVDKIIVGGHSLVNGIPLFTLMRINSNGSTDGSFGNNGIITTDFGGSSNINSIALQSDDKIVAVGNMSDGFYSHIALARYNSDGSPDLTFNGNGKVITDGGLSLSNAKSVVVQNDGKIVVGSVGFEIVRYNDDGSLDPSFNGIGYKTIEFENGGGLLASISLQDDGKVIAGGYSYRNGGAEFALARLNIDGSYDNTFGTEGRTLTDIGSTYEFITSTTIQKDGAILAVGSGFINFGYDFMLSRYDDGGNLDVSFGNEGKVIDHFPAGNINFGSLLLQSDGKLLVQTNTYDGIVSNAFIKRYNTDGTKDETYNNNAVINFPAIQSDDKLLNPGSTFGENGFDLMISRYNTDGSIDELFGNNGNVITDLGGNEFLGPTMVQKDGKILSAGYIYDLNYISADPLLIRYTSEGNLDPSFGDNGKVITDFIDSGYPQGLTMGNDGKIIVAGYVFNSLFETDFFLARYNSDGSLDGSFGQGGTLIADFNESDFAGGSVVVIPDGKILVTVGTGNYYNGYSFFVFRYNSDGTIDDNFGQNGKTQIKGLTILLQDDGKILVTGGIINNQNNSDFGFQRINSDGTIDLSFGNNGQIVTEISPGDDLITSPVLSGNKLFVAGNSFFPNGSGILAKYLLEEQSVTLLCPSNQTVSTDNGFCAAKVYNIDAVISPANNNPIIRYKLTGATEGEGIGSVSGKVFNKGVTNITYSLDSDPTKSCTFTVTVQDLEAPAVSNVSTNLTSLWPPDHKLINITVNYTMSDNCGASSVITVTSNEPELSTEREDKTPDWQIIDDHHIKLRAERLETGNGRIYTIKISTTDLSGNQTTKTTTVKVPKNKLPITNTQTTLKVTALPNPASDNFSIDIKSNNEKDKINLRLLNDKGSVVQTISNLLPNQIVKIGSSLKSGVYFVEIIQENCKETIKLIKL